MTIYALAKASELPWQTVKNLVNQMNNPTVSTIEMLCNGLGITMSQFFAENEESFSLTSEQKHIIDQWNALSADEKRVFFDLLNLLSNAKK